MLEAILNYNFMQYALLAALLASIVSGVIGTIIVEKKLVSMSGGIAHASFGGIGLGYFLGIEPILGGIFVAAAASISVGQIQRKRGTSADTLISMLWAAGMALGILFIGLTHGYPPDMTSYLFGDILTVNDLYLVVMTGMVALIVLTVITLFNYFKLYLFDESYAGIIGIPVKRLETILYLMIAVSIVVLIKVVGIILTLALLTIPTATAKLFTYQLKFVMMLATIISMMYCLIGLTLSYYLNIPSGAGIILTAITIYFVLATGKAILNRRNNEYTNS